jgi:hypothetical protein
MPTEFVAMLKSSSVNFSTNNPLSEIQTTNKALYLILEKAFKEFSPGKINLEKVFNTLGWLNFRDRLCSVYLSKILFDKFPEFTDTLLVDEIKQFESRYAFFSVTSHSRLFLLGFFLKLNALELGIDNIKSGEEITLVNPPKGLEQVLSISKVKNDKPDWVILICWYLVAFLGFYKVQSSIMAGKSFSEILADLMESERDQLMKGLLAYGASIGEDEWFNSNLI